MKNAARQDSKSLSGNTLGWTKTTRVNPVAAPQSVICTRAVSHPPGDAARKLLKGYASSATLGSRRKPS
ncbi:MAG: hypothetical protein ABW275_10825, partial [Hansschlegelia sp.]